MDEDDVKSVEEFEATDDCSIVVDVAAAMNGFERKKSMHLKRMILTRNVKTDSDVETLVFVD
jgi:hypothetical protein